MTTMSERTGDVLPFLRPGRACLHHNRQCSSFRPVYMQRLADVHACATATHDQLVDGLATVAQAWHMGMTHVQDCCCLNLPHRQVLACAHVTGMHKCVLCLAKLPCIVTHQASVSTAAQGCDALELFCPQGLDAWCTSCLAALSCRHVLCNVTMFSACPSIGHGNAC